MSQWTTMWMISIEWSDPELAEVDMLDEAEWFDTKSAAEARFKELVDAANEHDEGSDELYTQRLRLDELEVMYGTSKKKLVKLLSGKSFARKKTAIRHYQKYTPKRG